MSRVVKPSTAKVYKTLYRTTLRIAKGFDATPATKFLIFARDRYSQERTAEKAIYQEAMSDFLGSKNRHYLMPDRDVSVESLVRKYYRMPIDELEGTLHDRVDAGFLAVRDLSSKWHLASKYMVHRKKGDASHRPPEQPETTATPTASPFPYTIKPAKSLGPSVLLLAHPIMCDSVFQRTVIILLKHDKVEGSYGLILNKSTGFDIQKAVKGGGLSSDFFRAFSNCAVRAGGPVARLQMVHSVDAVGGHSVKKGGQQVFVSGDVNEATHLVLSGEHKAEDFNFFVGACTWAGGQLESEIEKGYWITCQAPPSVALEYRPNLWEEVLVRLGGATKAACEVPETLLPQLLEAV